MKGIYGYLGWYLYILKKALKPKKTKKESEIVWRALEEIEKNKDFSVANKIADDFLAKKARIDLWDANALFFMISRSQEFIGFIKDNPDLVDRSLSLMARGNYKENFKILNELYRDPERKRFYLLENVKNARWITGNEDLEGLSTLSVVEVGGVGDGLYASAVYGYLQHLAEAYSINIKVFVDKRLQRIYSRTYSGVKFIPCVRHYTEVSRFLDAMKKAKHYYRLPRRVLSRYFDNSAFEEFRKSENIITSMGIIYKVYGEHERYEWDLKADGETCWRFASRMPGGKTCGLALGSMNMRGARSHDYNEMYEESLLTRVKASFVLFNSNNRRSGKNVMNFDIDRINDFDSLLAVAKNIDFFVGDATTNTFLAARAGCPTILLTRGAFGEIYRSKRGQGFYFMRNIKCMNTLDLKDGGDTLEQLLDIMNSANPAYYILND